MKKNINLSLKVKIIGSFILIILLSSISVGMYSINQASKTIENSLGNSSMSILNSIVGSIDAEGLKKLQNPDDMKSNFYIEFRNRLDTLRKSLGLKYLYTMRKTNDGKYIYLVDGQPEGSEDASLLGDEEKEISPVQKESFEGQSGYELVISKEWGNLISGFVPIKDRSGAQVGILGADFNADYMIQAIKNIKQRIFVMLIILIFVGIILSGALVWAIISSLKELIEKAKIIEKGDLTVSIDIKKKDEVGLLGQTLNSVVQSMASITKNIRENTKTVIDYVNQLNSRADHTSQVSEDISNIVNEIANGALEQSKRVEEVSLSMQEVLNQAGKSTQQADKVLGANQQAIEDVAEATAIFKESIEKVERVHETINGTVITMNALGERSNQISEFSKVISQIASQTNLLALNAEIEAARAGEHGKGFSVVAAQIKKLSEESSAASKQINEVVSGIREEIEKTSSIVKSGLKQSIEGVESVNKVNSYFDNIINSSEQVIYSVMEVQEAISRIKENSGLAVSNIKGLADISNQYSIISQQAASSTEEQLAIIHEMGEYLQSLKQMSIQLENAVNKFKVD